MFGALAPFFAPVCREFAGQMFDAAAFSDAVAKLYGLRIPRLAVLGMTEQLEGQGLLVPVVGKASMHPRFVLPSTEPDFKVGTWTALDALHIKLEASQRLEATTRIAEEMTYVAGEIGDHREHA